MVKNTLAKTGDIRDSGPAVSERSSGRGNGNPLLFYCLENPMNRGAWWVTQFMGRKESDSTEVT